MVGWKLDELLDIRDQPFTDDIGTLPLHFETTHWEILYDHGKDWDRDSQRKIMDRTIQLETCIVNPPGNRGGAPLKMAKNTFPQSSPNFQDL